MSPYVLVVDDDAGIRDMVSQVLDLEGYKVEVAPDGVNALLTMQRHWPSLILLDMQMPVMNGWELADRLHKKHEHVPIIVMTAGKNARSCARDIGAEGYLAKPFDLEDLLATVEHLIQPPSEPSPKPDR